MADTRSDEELVAAGEDAASAAARAMMKALCVSGPGIVMSFDPATQTAKVRPAIKRRFVGIGSVEPPPCVDVPVQFPAGGDFVLTFPVREGDECILIFGDRAIDNWFSNGGVQEPNEIRFHDPSDAMALVGISSRPRFLNPGVGPTGAEIRTRDGELIFRVAPGTISLGVKHVQPVPCGNDLVQVLSDFLDACIALTVTNGAGPSTPPNNVADFAAIKSRLQTILSKTVLVQKEP